MFLKYRLMGDDLTISVISGNPNRQLRGATHVFVHPELNFLTFDNNVAIIRTDTPFLVSLTFNPVFRPDDSPQVNTECSVAGWGSISNVCCVFKSNNFHLLCASLREVRFLFNCYVSMQQLYLERSVTHQLHTMDQFELVCFVLEI